MESQQRLIKGWAKADGHQHLGEPGMVRKGLKRRFNNRAGLLNTAGLAFD